MLLTQETVYCDFPVMSKFVLDIESEDGKVSSFLVKVKGHHNIEKIHTFQETPNLSVGQTLQVKIISRFDDTETFLEVEIIEEDYYVDYFLIEKKSDLLIPSGFQPPSEPFYCPPINFPSYPVGYSNTGAPFYDKPKTLKHIPLGMIISGKRFYGENEEQAQQSIMDGRKLVGFDNSGFPFFLLGGYIIPPPAGYTSDGIPYYSFQGVIQMEGNLVNQSDTKNLFFTMDDDIQHPQKISNNFSLRSSIKHQPNLDLTPLKSISSSIYKQKIVADPPILKFFQSGANVTNSWLVKYKLEKNLKKRFYLFLEPREIFSSKVSCYILQGEGVFEIKITCRLNSVLTENVKGNAYFLNEGIFFI
jgi:hypothetical protein